jgi:transcriptional regulator with XRE-family HTH domain
VKKKYTSELGQRLKKLLLALGLKQKEMAIAAGLNTGYLSDLISGKRENPGIETILKIANRFNVSLNYLLLGEGEMFLPDKEEVLKKEKELKLGFDNIDDLYRVMKRKPSERKSKRSLKKKKRKQSSRKKKTGHERRYIETRGIN